MIRPPSNYRKLKDNEKPRKGDWYCHIAGNMHDIMCANSYEDVKDYPGYEFFRRRHIKVIKPKVSAVDSSKPKNVTIVSFLYNEIKRYVQVISLDEKYLKGLEITQSSENTSKLHYQFKSYLRNKIFGAIRLESYGPVK